METNNKIRVDTLALGLQCTAAAAEKYKKDNGKPDAMDITRKDYAANMTRAINYYYRTDCDVVRLDQFLHDPSNSDWAVTSNGRLRAGLGQIPEMMDAITPIINTITGENGKLQMITYTRAINNEDIIAREYTYNNTVVKIQAIPYDINNLSSDAMRDIITRCALSGYIAGRDKSTHIIIVDDQQIPGIMHCTLTPEAAYDIVRKLELPRIVNEITGKQPAKMCYRCDYCRDYVINHMVIPPEININNIMGTGGDYHVH